ncbi:MAG: prepilin-type N-terminal cleavage/methylation domain-containing protein [Phycisphaerae bacterium]
MKRVAKKGFTLVEILIVVIILGILAAIVIPQFTEASGEARVSNLMTNLQTIRSQLLLYKTQHLETYPAAAAGEDFADQMTSYTDVDGTVSATPDSDFPYGPYLQSIPVNPISGDNTVTVVLDGATAFAAPAADGGWWFNSVTGEFRANLTDARTATDGTTKLNEL